MPISLHSHSGEFCKHAFGTLEETVRRAIELGFTHYGLSEHMPRYESDDLYDEEIEVNIMQRLHGLNFRTAPYFIMHAGHC